jgi:catechol 2,3-dioxygenase-like lactoylglutathione lyase family enzyme
MDPVPFHIGIATDDLDASMRELGGVLGVTWTEPSAGPGEFVSVDGVPQPRPTASVSKEGPIHVDLVKGKPGTLWEAATPRLHHFGYWTDDLVADIARLAEHGWRLELTKPDADGRPTQFAYLVRDDGMRLELIDEVGRVDYYARLQSS